jgi:hypothetical protein
VALAVGDRIVHVVEVVNVGATTLWGVRLSEAALGEGGLVVAAWPDPMRPGVLGPGQRVVARGERALTVEDLEAGHAVHVPTVHANAVFGAGDDPVAVVEVDTPLGGGVPEPSPSEVAGRAPARLDGRREGGRRRRGGGRHRARGEIRERKEWTCRRRLWSRGW